MSFPDGAFPPQDIITKWLNLCRRVFETPEHGKVKTVGVHCVAGLGRAPVLVAIALIEGGMKYQDAIQLIRSKRRGAINGRQLEALKKYKRSKGCIIM